jgi:hypothetical protein
MRAALSRMLPPGSAPPAHPEQSHAAIPAWPELDARPEIVPRSSCRAAVRYVWHLSSSTYETHTRIRRQRQHRPLILLILSLLGESSAETSRERFGASEAHGPGEGRGVMSSPCRGCSRWRSLRHARGSATELRCSVAPPPGCLRRCRAVDRLRDRNHSSSGHLHDHLHRCLREKLSPSGDRRIAGRATRDTVAKYLAEA